MFTLEEFVAGTLKEIFQGVKKVQEESKKSADGDHMPNIEFDLTLSEDMKVMSGIMEGESANRIKFSIQIVLPRLR